MGYLGTHCAIFTIFLYIQKFAKVKRLIKKKKKGKKETLPRYFLPSSPLQRPRLNEKKKIIHSTTVTIPIQYATQV